MSGKFARRRARTVKGGALLRERAGLSGAAGLCRRVRVRGGGFCERFL